MRAYKENREVFIGRILNAPKAVDETSDTQKNDSAKLKDRLYEIMDMLFQPEKESPFETIAFLRRQYEFSRGKQ